MKICLVRPTFGSRFQIAPLLSLEYIAIMEDISMDGSLCAPSGE